MDVQLNSVNFFKYFIIRPLSPSLAKIDRLKATTISVALGAFTFGFIPVISSVFFFDRRIVKKNVPFQLPIAKPFVKPALQSKVEKSSSLPLPLKLPSDHSLQQESFLFWREWRMSTASVKLSSEQIEKVRMIGKWPLPEILQLVSGDKAMPTIADVDKEMLSLIEELVKVSRQRINELESAVEFRKRWYRVKDVPHSHRLQARDLEVPWDQSALKIALQSNEELAKLPLGELKKLNSHQWDVLELRTHPNPNTPLIQEAILDESWDSYTLGDFWQRHPSVLPLSNGDFLKLLNSAQLRVLDCSGLNREQVATLFSSSLDNKELNNRSFERFQLLDAQQLSGCLKYLENPFLSAISQSLIKELTPQALGELRAGALCTLLQGTKGDPQERVEKLDIPQLNSCLGEMASFHLKWIKTGSLKDLDPFALQSLTSENLNALLLGDNFLNDAGIQARVQSLQKDQLKRCYRQFPVQFKDYLSSSQKEGLIELGLMAKDR